MIKKLKTIIHIAVTHVHSDGGRERETGRESGREIESDVSWLFHITVFLGIRLRRNPKRRFQKENLFVAIPIYKPDFKPEV